MSSSTSLTTSASSSSTATTSGSTKKTKSTPVAFRVPDSAKSLVKRGLEAKRVRGEEKESRWSNIIQSSSKKSKIDSSAQSSQLDSTGQNATSAESQSALDLFFRGMVRGVTGDVLTDYVAASWRSNPELTLQILMQGRDARDGKGEKACVREALMWLRENKPLTYLMNLIEFLRLGYLKDLLALAKLVVDRHLPTLGVTPDVPIEIEILAEFLREDEANLKKWKEKQLRREAAKAKAASGDASTNVDMEDGELVEMEDIPKDISSSSSTTATSSSSSSSSSSAVQSSQNDFELMTKPSTKNFLTNPAVVVPKKLKIDLCFVIDRTGSMGPWLEATKSSIRQIVTSMKTESMQSGADEVQFRLALVAYEDYFDAHRYDLMDFTENVDKYLNLVKSLQPEGGGDEPEDLINGLEKALEFSWCPDADAIKFLILIADAPAHGAQFGSSDSPESTRYLQQHPEYPDRTIRAIREKGIRFSFTRITPSTDRMLEAFQGWYDNRRTRKVLNVMQLGQSVSKFLPAVMELLTLESLGRMPTETQEASTINEDDDLDRIMEREKAAASSSSTSANATSSTVKSKKPASCPLSLAGKWTPTEKTHFDKKPYFFASSIAKLLYPESKFSSKQYRQLCSTLREELQVVERAMCTQQWGTIDFARVPAKAHKLLKKAFQKHEASRYAMFLGKVKKGEVTMKTATLQPHELTEAYRRMTLPLRVDETTELQWKALVTKLKKDICGGADQPRHTNALAVIDTSGSMTWNLQLTGRGRGSSNLSDTMSSTAPIDVAISLGLLIAELTNGPFANRVLTFSEQPQWVMLPSAESATLCDRVDAIYSQAESGGTTNVEATLRMILDVAKSSQCSPTDLPSMLFILSDMDLDQGLGKKSLNLKSLGEEFGAAGYRIPELCFWNLSSRSAAPARPPPSSSSSSVVPQCVPGVELSEHGVALLSGYSPSLLKLALKQEFRISPMRILADAVAPYQNVQVEEAER